MNYNENAIHAIFDNKKNLKQVIDDVLYNFEYDEDSQFEEVMDQFFEDFNNVAAELVAEKVLGMDMSHYYIRANHPMNAKLVQHTIDNVIFKDFDSYVNVMFSQINAGDYVLAYETYKFTFHSKKVDQPELTEKRFNNYLTRVNKELGILRNPLNFRRLGQLAENQKLHDQLQADLPGTAQDEATGNAAPSQASGLKKINKV